MLTFGSIGPFNSRPRYRHWRPPAAIGIECTTPTCSITAVPDHQIATKHSLSTLAAIAPILLIVSEFICLFGIKKKSNRIYVITATPNNTAKPIIKKTSAILTDRRLISQTSITQRMHETTQTDIIFICINCLHWHSLSSLSAAFAALYFQSTIGMHAITVRLREWPFCNRFLRWFMWLFLPLCAAQTWFLSIFCCH